MTDILYEKLVKHWEEVTDIPPQRVGRFTPLYKEFTKRLKIMPWPVLIAISIVAVLVVYYLFGPAVTLIASLLQRGF